MKRKKGARFDIYKDRSGEWRWRLFSQNGQIVAGPQEGYKRMSGAVRAIRSTVAAMLTATSR